MSELQTSANIFSVLMTGKWKQLNKAVQEDVKAGGQGWQTIDKRGQNILIAAVEQNQLEIVKNIITKKHIDVNIQDLQGWTPLHVACNTGNFQIISLLLTSKDIETSILSNTRSSALSYLIRANTPPNQKALHFELLMKILGENKDNVNCGNINGETPLHCLANCRAPYLLEAANFLIYHGADLEATTDTGETPLISAIRFGNYDLVKRFLSLGVSVSPVILLGFENIRTRKNQETSKIEYILDIFLKREFIIRFQKYFETHFDVQKFCFARIEEQKKGEIYKRYADIIVANFIKRVKSEQFMSLPFPGNTQTSPPCNSKLKRKYSNSSILPKLCWDDKYFYRFIKHGIRKEISNTTDPELLFRGESFVVYLLTEICESLIGKEFLQKIFEGLFYVKKRKKNEFFLSIKIAKGLKNLEIDRVKLQERYLSASDLSAEEQKKKIDEMISNNKTNLLKFIELIIDNLILYLNTLPKIVKKICRFIWRKTNQKFKALDRFGDKAITGILFLRFICPAIVSPEKFGLIPNPSIDMGSPIFYELLVQNQNYTESNFTQELDSVEDEEEAASWTGDESDEIESIDNSSSSEDAYSEVLLTPKGGRKTSGYKGLRKEERRGLVLVAKILQNVMNGNAVFEKEEGVEEAVSPELVQIKEKASTVFGQLVQLEPRTEPSEKKDTDIDLRKAFILAQFVDEERQKSPKAKLFSDELHKILDSVREYSQKITKRKLSRPRPLAMSGGSSTSLDNIDI